MERLWRIAKRLALGAVVVVFFGLGLLMLAFGERQDRFVGLVVVVFFGIGGGGVLLMPLIGRRSDPVSTTRVRYRAADRQALVFPIVRGRLALATIASAAMAAAGVVIALSAGTPTAGDDTEGQRWVGWLAAGVFGLFALLGLRSTTGGPAYVALLPEGVVVHAATATTFVPWGAINEIGRSSIRGNEFLGLSVSDPAAIETTAWRWLQAANRAVSRWDVSIPTAALAGDADLLERALHHYLERPAERPELGTPATEWRLALDGVPR